HCLFEQFDGAPFARTAVVLGMPTGPLSDERVRIIVPAEPAEAAGIETLGVLPQAGVVTGSVEVEDDVVVTVKAVPTPGEWLPDPSRDRGEERVEATDFLDEGLQIGFVPLGECLPPLRMASQRHCREYDESRHGQDRIVSTYYIYSNETTVETR